MIRFCKLSIFSCLLLIIGCNKVKQVDNLSPLITLDEPFPLSPIYKDTNLIFNFKAVDTDGSIEKIEIQLDGNVLKTLTTSPFTFTLNTLNYPVGEHTLQAIAFDNKGATSKVSFNFELINFLTRWLGTYTGASRHNSTYPKGGVVENTEVYKNVEILVNKGKLDSTLSLFLSYDDSSKVTHLDIKMDSTGAFRVKSGDGRYLNSLVITFPNDSINYSSYSGCGVSCSSLIKINIAKLK